MKKLILILLFIPLSCNNISEQNNTEISEINESEDKNNIGDILLGFESEKIALMSIIKEINVEKTFSVLSDYLNKWWENGYFQSPNVDPIYIDKVIDTIAKENGISKKMTASIIFMYEFEMITEDEIIDEFIDTQNIDDYLDTHNYD